jgi:hypothetical protein
VTTVPFDLKVVAEPSLLRSYTRPASVPHLPPIDHSWLIVDAILATSAAPSYFEPFRLSTGHAFKDAGAFGFNNPTAVAINEAKRIQAFNGRTIGCVVSLGTGMESLLRGSRITRRGSGSRVKRIFNRIVHLKDIPSRLNALKDDLVSTATNTQQTHNSVCEQLTLQYQYFDRALCHII